MRRFCAQCGQWRRIPRGRVMTFKKSAFFLLTALCVAIGSVAILPGYPLAQHAFFANQKVGQIDVLAHGAGQGVAPTETMLALKTANDSGADVLEVDVQLTRDNVLVLHHDDTFDRTTDLTGPVENLTWAQIEAGDKGATVTLGGTTFSGIDTKVARLDTALAAFSKSRWNIEIKNDSANAAAQLCQDVKRAGLESGVLVASFHDAAMAEFRRLCPKVATSMAPREIRVFVIAAKLGLSRFVTTPAVAVQVPVEASGFDLTSSRFIAALKHRNIKLHYWTINDPAQMRTLIGIGADGLLTDYVLRAREAIADKR